MKMLRRLQDNGRILFVGNNLISCAGGINNELEKLAQSAGIRIKQSAEAIGGFTLRNHLERNQTLAAVTSGNWDIVVFQEYSSVPIADRTSFISAGSQLALLARIHGAIPVLMSTWGYITTAGSPSDAQMTIAIKEAYEDLGRNIRAEIVHTGLAMQRASDSGFSIFIDNQHQNIYGTYLAACVFFGFLFGRPETVLGHPDSISCDIATKLQEIAWQTLAETSNFQPG